MVSRTCGPGIKTGATCLREPVIKVHGALKRTLIRIMLGLIKPDAGEMHIMGREARGEDFRDVRRSIGYLPENVIFYDNLSGLETMRFFAGLKGADPKTCVVLLAKVGLGDARERPVRGHSTL